MTPARKWFVHAVIAVVILGHAYVIVRKRELWPFSCYPMFTALNTPKVLDFKMVGLSGEGKTEIPLLQSYTPGLAVDRAARLLRKYAATKDADPVQLEKMASAYLNEYERRRTAKLHNGPPIAGLRVYEINYHIEPRAANRGQPDEVKLLAEVHHKGVGNAHAG
jgi:hypothetical protein